MTCTTGLDFVQFTCILSELGQIYWVKGMSKKNHVIVDYMLKVNSIVGHVYVIGHVVKDHGVMFDCVMRHTLCNFIYLFCIFYSC
jgi:hypothetical protein